MNALKNAILILIAVSAASGSKILGVFPTPSISHQIVFQPIWKELSLRGHEVTVITPDPLKDPGLTNLTEIDISSCYKHLTGVVATFKTERTHWDFLNLMSDHHDLMWKDILENPGVASLLNDSTTNFDLVIGEFLHSTVTAFAYRYSAPFIAIASLSLVSTGHEAVGTPAHPLLYPDMLTTFGEDMTFYEKIDAVLYAIRFRYDYYNVFIPMFDKFARRYFGEDMPSLAVLERNVSMVFLNTNPVIHGARPYPPGVIELGKMHIKPKKPLPTELKSFLDEAKEGVIYFSLGSNIKSINIDEDKRKSIMEVFSELPYKVLWKFENESMPDKPANVKISQWLPQQDLLGHPNIKLFITQAGLQSTEEAITNHVPLLALPFMADQHFNAKKITKLGIGLHLKFSSLTKEEFKEAILEITGNPKYKEKIKEVSNLLDDRPNTGLERAVWWTEYVLRHKGAPYFRPAVVDMPWYKYFLLDVLGFIFTVISVTVYLAYVTLSYVLCKLCALSSVRTKLKAS